MFGMGLGELVVVAMVALVVIGPKDLPAYLRRAGAFARKLRLMAGELRAQSGIDEVLRDSNLRSDFAEINRLAKGEIDSISRGASLGEPRTSQGATRWGDSDAIVFPCEFPHQSADAEHAVPAHLAAYGEPDERGEPGQPEKTP